MGRDEFLARDVYRIWKQRVAEASESVWVFTPYLDKLLVRLLAASTAVPVTAIDVVTDLSPASGSANYRTKLLAIRSLLTDGIAVRTLPRLHAKVLVVDGRGVTVGSQNFTTYARGSREATAVPQRDMSDTRFLATLGEWLSDATVVDLAYVDLLLERLEEPAAAHDLAHRRLLEAFEEQERLRQERLAEAERTRQEAARAAEEALRQEQARSHESMARALRSALNRTAYRSPQGTAYAELRTVESSAGHDYQTLMAGSGYDLTRWCRNGGPQVLRLKSFGFYPLILCPSGRMAFARLTTTRITYVRSGVRFNHSQRIGGRDCFVTLTFPSILDRGANVIVELRPNSAAPAGYKFGLRFDGESARVAWEGAIGTDRPAAEAVFRQLYTVRMRDAGRDAMHDPDATMTFFAGLLDNPITFDRANLDAHNADEFFERGVYRLDVIDAHGSHVLVAQLG
ncbi:phospholipase D family protein [Dactylosporangium sp. NPDC051484]|uniref:phospholipase D family protein n=1 Tax=Dactylosporangium sp. NPDC051484 TaxID=3154942 RepID=UPI00344D8DF6